jgi:hypothetical protein
MDKVSSVSYNYHYTSCHQSNSNKAKQDDLTFLFLHTYIHVMNMSDMKCLYSFKHWYDKQ